jgi:hypothetical protein
MKNISDGRKDKWKDERTDGRTDRRTEVKQYTPSPSGTGGIKNQRETKGSIYLYRSTNVVTIKNIIECPTMKNNFQFETSY